MGEGKLWRKFGPRQPEIYILGPTETNLRVVYLVVNPCSLVHLFACSCALAARSSSHLCSNRQ